MMGAAGDIRDILRGALASLGGFGGRMIARLALMVVAGTMYGAASLGILGQIAAITEILAAVAVLGLKRSLLDMLHEKKNQGRELNVIKEALCVSLIFAMLMSFILWLAWPTMFPDIPMPLILLIAVPAFVFAEVAGSAIRFKRVIRFEVLARCVMEPWSFFIAAVSFYYLGFAGEGLLLAYAVSTIAAALGIMRGFVKVYPLSNILAAPFAIRSIYEIPKRSVSVGITDLGVMMVRRLDILVLSLVAGHQATGIYYMAQQIVTVPHKVHQLFEPMMAPVLAKLHHAADRSAIASQLAGFCRWVFILQLAITIPFLAFSSDLLAIFGEAFASGGLVLIMLLIAELCDGSFALTEIALVYARPTVPPKLVLTALSFELVFIYLLGSVWGAEGAAFGFLLAMVLLAVARLVSLRKCLGIYVFGTAFIHPFVAALTLLLILLSVQESVNIQALSVMPGTIILSAGVYVWFMIKFASTEDDKAALAQIKSP